MLDEDLIDKSTGGERITHEHSIMNAKDNVVIERYLAIDRTRGSGDLEKE